MIGEIAKRDQEAAIEVNRKMETAIRDFRDGCKCQRCGKCCQEGVGVALWPHEFQRLKKLHKHMNRYVGFIGNWYALKMPCVFYNKWLKRCSIYKHRPIACRMYPLGIKADGTTRVSENCTAIKLTNREV